VPTRLLAALAAGIGLALGFEPFGLVLLAPPALALFFGSARGTSLRGGAAVGAAFGLAFFGVHLFWMRALGTEPWIALTLLETSFLIALGIALAALSRSRRWPVWFAVAWLAAETVRGAVPFGGLTWGQLGLGVIDTPVAAWLPWTGVSGATLVVAMLAAGLTWAVTEARPRAGLVAAGAAAVALGVPVVVSPPSTAAGEATVALVQGDVPGEGNDLVGHFREVTSNQSTATIALAERVARGEVDQPDFVVWPENSTAIDPFDDVQTRDDIERAVAAIGVPVLVGAIVDDPNPGRVLNQGIVYDPVTGAGERYAKFHPVPFGEYVPYRWLFRKRFTERLGLVRRDMAAGTRATPIQVDGIPVAGAICFDIAFDDTLGPQVRRGARIGVVQTSNALFIHTGQVAQQFAISRVRAKEIGRAVVVASVNGRSGVIDADGSVISQSPVRTQDVLVETVTLRTSRPVSLWVGPWLGRVAVALVSLGLLFTCLPYVRRNTRRVPPAEAYEPTPGRNP
jgi:apolipoprotein N-acyltransferase